MFRRRRSKEVLGPIGREGAASVAGRAEGTPESRDEALSLLRRLRGECPENWNPPDPTWLAASIRRLVDALAVLDVAPETMSALETAVERPDDPEVLHLAGFHLADIGLSDLAVAPLARSLALRPGHAPTIDELALALGDGSRQDEAARLYRENPVVLDKAESSRALYCHYAAMTGDLSATRQMIPLIEPAGPYGFFRNREVGRVLRAAALREVARLDSSDLRGWEMVLNGMLLLQRAEFGAEGMNGRFGAVWDNTERFGQVVGLLHQVLERLDRMPTRVVAAGDRDSQILGWAVSNRLGLGAPADPSAVVAEDETTLVAVYEWANFDPMYDRYASDPNALLFGYSLDWTTTSSVAPDVVGVEAQRISPAWGEQLVVLSDVDGAPGMETITQPADDRDPQDLGAHLAGQPSSVADRWHTGELFEIAATLPEQPAAVGLLGERGRCTTRMVRCVQPASYDSPHGITVLMAAHGPRLLVAC